MRRLFLLWLLSATLLTSGCVSGSRPTRIGTAAREFTVQDSERTVSLNQFRGQVVILNFWATWCPPCVEELPSMIAMQDRVRGKGIVVLGVSIDVDDDAYHRFLKLRNVNFLTVRDPEQKVAGIVRHHRLARNLHHRSPGRSAPEVSRRRRLEFPRSDRFPEQAVAVVRKQFCHPDRSRSSGAGKDLSRHRRSVTPGPLAESISRC